VESDEFVRNHMSPKATHNQHTGTSSVSRLCVRSRTFRKPKPTALTEMNRRHYGSYRQVEDALVIAVSLVRTRSPPTALTKHIGVASE